MCYCMYAPECKQAGNLLVPRPWPYWWVRSSQKRSIAYAARMPWNTKAHDRGTPGTFREQAPEPASTRRDLSPIDPRTVHFVAAAAAKKEMNQKSEGERSREGGTISTGRRRALHARKLAALAHSPQGSLAARTKQTCICIDNNCRVAWTLYMRACPSPGRHSQRVWRGCMCS